MRKISSILLMSALALAFLFVAGCGDDDDDESASTGTTTTPSEEAPAPTGKSVEDVDVSLTEYKVTVRSVIPKGVVTLNVTNDGSITHALEAEGPSGETKTEDLAPGDSAELKVNFENGSYELYCPISNHRELGMTTEQDVSG